MSLLQKALERGSFAVTAEMAPPKGYDVSEALETAALLRGKVHGVNVTDMQSACLKASSLGLCIHLKQAGIEPILQMTGRDRSRMALMADILSAASFGIDTMLALTGDHPVVGDCREQAGVRSGLRGHSPYAVPDGEDRHRLRWKSPCRWRAGVFQGRCCDPGV